MLQFIGYAVVEETTVYCWKSGVSLVLVSS